MTYYESAEGEKISFVRAVMDIEKHGVSVLDFLEEMGQCESYDAQKVLEWLGY